MLRLFIGCGKYAACRELGCSKRHVRLQLACATVVLLGCATAATAAVVYVAPATNGGDDHSTGGINDPVATIDHAIELLDKKPGEARLAVGRYDGLVQLRGGVVVSGGYKIRTEEQEK